MKTLFYLWRLTLDPRLIYIQTNQTKSNQTNQTKKLQKRNDLSGRTEQNNKKSLKFQTTKHKLFNGGRTSENDY